VHVQDPKVSAHHFDWIAAPKHDGLTGPNVTTTLGAVHGFNPIRVAEGEGTVREPDWLVTAPSDNRALRGKQPGFPLHSARCRELWTVASHDGAREQWIPSCYPLRPHLACGIAGDFRHPKFRLEWHRRKSYLALLGFADVIVVTGDSVNMVTEAAGTGKPVYVHHLQGIASRGFMPPCLRRAPSDLLRAIWMIGLTNP